MSNPIGDAGHEVGTDWSYGAPGGLRAAVPDAHGGAYVGRVGIQRGQIFGNYTGSMEQTVVLPDLTPRRLRFWIRNTQDASDPNFYLRVEIYDGTASKANLLWRAHYSGSQPSPTWVEITSDLVTPTGFTGTGVIVYVTSGYDPAGSPNPIGVVKWEMDDWSLAPDQEAEDVAKRKAIRAAVVAAIEGITIAGGYTHDVASSTVGHTSILTLTEFPAVQTVYGPERKEYGEMHRKKGYLELGVLVVAKDTDTELGHEACDDVCADIETCLETQSAGQFIGLAYVDNLTVERIEPWEVDESVSKGTRVWIMTVLVIYRYTRTEP